MSTLISWRDAATEGLHKHHERRKKNRRSWSACAWGQGQREAHLVSGVRRPTVATGVRLGLFPLGEVVAHFEDKTDHLAAHGQADSARDDKHEIHARFLPLSVK